MDDSIPLQGGPADSDDTAMLDPELFYRNLFDNLYDGVYFIDHTRTVTFWNKGAERLTGYTKEEMVGAHCSARLLSHVDEQGACMCNGRCPMGRVLATGQPLETELFFHHKNGHRMPVLTRNSPILGGQDQVIGAVQIFSDNSARRDMATRIAELQRLALVDPVTGLPNRRQLDAALAARLDEMRRYFVPFAVLMSDIDQFKEINDRFGHEVGDSALRMVGQSIRSAIRAFDVAGRWGGDEFLAVLPHAAVPTLVLLAERVRAMVEQSFLQSGPDIVKVTISVGATIAGTGDTIESLVARADDRMRDAKKLGKNRALV